MVLTIVRRPSVKGATISRWYLDGVVFCYGCEDVVRPPAQKIFGKSAIPAGTYKAIINRSERFSKLAGHDVLLPLLLNVPGFNLLFDRMQQALVRGESIIVIIR
jgi:hypothetical protein